MVKNLLIIRHCEASLNSEINRDFDRPLTNKGKNQATVLGQWIDSLPLELDAFYESSIEGNSNAQRSKRGAFCYTKNNGCRRNL